MEISTDVSNKVLILLSEKDFQKYHGHYGDTCKENLGGIIWKESEGILKIYFVGQYCKLISSNYHNNIDFLFDDQFILEHEGKTTIAVLTGIISHTGVTNKHMKCADNNKPKPKQLQKKKRKHESSSPAQNENSATHLTTSTMVVKHVDWIKQIAMKGSCNLVEDGKL